jgi:hypothetical protein
VVVVVGAPDPDVAAPPPDSDPGVGVTDGVVDGAVVVVGVRVGTYSCVGATCVDVAGGTYTGEFSTVVGSGRRYRYRPSTRTNAARSPAVEVRTRPIR